MNIFDKMGLQAFGVEQVFTAMRCRQPEIDASLFLAEQAQQDIAKLSVSGNPIPWNHLIRNLKDYPPEQQTILLAQVGTRIIADMSVQLTKLGTTLSTLPAEQKAVIEAYFEQALKAELPQRRYGALPPPELSQQRYGTIPPPSFP